MKTKNERNESTGASGVASSDLLASLGFVRGVGFDGEVWTNPESRWMTQVWVCLSGKMDGDFWWFDARDGLDLGKFFSWWEARSEEEHYQTEAEMQLGDEW